MPYLLCSQFHVIHFVNHYQDARSVSPAPECSGIKNSVKRIVCRHPRDVQHLRSTGWTFKPITGNSSQSAANQISPYHAAAADLVLPVTRQSDLQLRLNCAQKFGPILYCARSFPFPMNINLSWSSECLLHASLDIDRKVPV
jgi:hypothetical protein